MANDIHFPSNEVLTWCGMPSIGLRQSTDMAEVTCPGCLADDPCAHKLFRARCAAVPGPEFVRAWERTVGAPDVGTITLPNFGDRPRVCDTPIAVPAGGSAADPCNVCGWPAGAHARVRADDGRVIDQRSDDAGPCYTTAFLPGSTSQKMIVAEPIEASPAYLGPGPVRAIDQRPFGGDEWQPNKRATFEPGKAYPPGVQAVCDSYENSAADGGPRSPPRCVRCGWPVSAHAGVTLEIDPRPSVSLSIAHVATLPDGTTVALPAGTVLREQTDPRDFGAVPPRAPGFFEPSGVLLAQARGLLQRARELPAFEAGARLRAEIDAFLAGLPVASKQAKADKPKQAKADKPTSLTVQALATRWARRRFEALGGTYPTWEEMAQRGREVQIAAMLPVAQEVMALFLGGAEKIGCSDARDAAAEPPPQAGARFLTAADADALSADPGPNVLRTLWYIAPLELRQKAAKATPTEAEPVKVIRTDDPTTLDVMMLMPAIPRPWQRGAPTTEDHERARQAGREAAVIEAACEVALLFSPGVSRDIDRLIAAVRAFLDGRPPSKVKCEVVRAEDHERAESSADEFFDAVCALLPRTKPDLPERREVLASLMDLVADTIFAWETVHMLATPGSRVQQTALEHIVRLRAKGR